MRSRGRIAREHLAEVKRKLADLVTLRRELEWLSGSAASARLPSAASSKLSRLALKEKVRRSLMAGCGGVSVRTLAELHARLRV